MPALQASSGSLFSSAPTRRYRSHGSFRASWLSGLPARSRSLRAALQRTWFSVLILAFCFPPNKFKYRFCTRSRVDVVRPFCAWCAASDFRTSFWTFVPGRQFDPFAFLRILYAVFSTFQFCITSPTKNRKNGGPDFRGSRMDDLRCQTQSLRFLFTTTAPPANPPTARTASAPPANI